VVHDLFKTINKSFQIMMNQWSRSLIIRVVFLKCRKDV
jgi:hypothetical protein